MAKTTLADFAKWMRDHRKAARPKLSGAAVAEHLKVSRQAVSHWEMGRKRIAPEHFQAWLTLIRLTDEQALEGWTLLGSAT